MRYLCGEPDGISISKAIAKVVDGKWILAPFQRPKAWKWKEQKALLESLLNGIPIGVVYIWNYDENNKHLATRGVPGISFSEDDVQALILDGQQRLSFLSWMKKSAVDPNFNQGPGLIYFNALEGQFTTKDTEDKKNGVIIVNNLMKIGYKLDVDNALFDNNKVLGQANYTEIKHKIDTLHNALTERKIVYQALDKRATMGDSFMIYERVNDAGKPLKGDDYVEAALFSLYPALHTEIQRAVHDLGLHPQDHSKSSFKKAFTRSNFIRSITDEFYHTHNPNSKKDYPLSLLMNFKDPKYYDFDSKKEKKLTENKIKETFKKVKNAYVHLKEILVDDLYMMDDEGINSTFCIPVNTYLRTVGPKISSHEKGQFIKWFILFHIQAKPYLGSQDRKIKEDCEAARGQFPFNFLLENLSNNVNGAKLEFTSKNTLIKFGRPGNKVKPQAKFLGHMQLMIGIYNGATDWFEHKKLEKVKRQDLHKHHIFPQKLYSKENKLTKDYIGNIARIIKRTNSSIKDKEPASKSYFPEISKRNSTALIAQQIPLTNQNLWKFSSRGLGKKFMEVRVKLLGEEINSFLKRCDNDTWHEKQAGETRLSFDEMLKSSETQELEFKESMLWMIKQNKGSKDFAFTISREIAGFMNNGGGTLFIGVQDDEKKPDRICLLYTSPSPRDRTRSRMPSSA